MGVPARIATMFLLCFQTTSFHLSTGYGISEDFFSSSEEARFASLLQGSGLAPLTFMAMTALMLYSYKDRGHGVAYVSPVLALLAVTLAAVMFVDDTDLIFASDCEEETAESFIDKVQDGVTDWAKTVMATGGEINLKKSFAKIWIPCFNRATGECNWTKKRRLPRAVLKVPQKDGSVEDTEIKDTDSAPKSLGAGVGF